MAKRLRDPDADVRMAALHRLLAVGAAGPLALSALTVAEIGERAKDKKADIRRAALVGLSKLYCAFVSSALPPLSSLGDLRSGSKASRAVGDVTSLVDREVLERFEGVPSAVIKSWGYPDVASRHLVVQLLQEQLLPLNGRNKQRASTSSSQQTSQEDSQSSSESQESLVCECRATALLLLHSLLVDEDRAMLGAILAFKARVRSALHSLLAARAATKNADQLSLASRKHTSALLQLLPAQEKKAPLFDKLLAAKDRIVFRLLDDCVAFRDSAKQAHAHREDLRRRLDSKSALGEYMGVVYDFAAGLLASCAMVSSLVAHTNALGVSEQARVHSDLLVQLAKHTPSVPLPLSRGDCG